MIRILWTQKEDEGPQQRAYAGIAYDSDRDRSVLFGEIPEIAYWMTRGSGTARTGRRWRILVHLHENSLQWPTTARDNRLSYSVALGRLRLTATPGGGMVATGRS